LRCLEKKTRRKSESVRFPSKGESIIITSKTKSAKGNFSGGGGDGALNRMTARSLILGKRDQKKDLMGGPSKKKTI